MPLPDLAAPPAPVRAGPAAPTRLDGVEALRGVAALLVVLAHVSRTMAGAHGYGAPPFGGAFNFGRAGVDFFFVLSGFIIATVHWADFGRPRRLGRFWVKRLLRIYPAYWVAAGLYAALLMASPTPDGAEQHWPHALASLFLLPEVAWPVLGVGWSLRHELVFYALFGTLILNRRLGTGVLAAWGALIAAGMALQLVQGSAPFGGVLGAIVLRGFNIEFFFGIAAAALLRGRAPARPGAIAAAGAVGFLATGLCESFLAAPMPEWPLRHLAYGASAAAVLLGTAARDRTGAPVPWPLIRLGGASYSLYLIHVPVILVGEYALRIARPLVRLPETIAFMLLVVLAVAAGLVFSRLVERPLQHLGRRWTGRKMPVPA